MRGKINLCVLLFLSLRIHAQDLPDSFIVFRDTVYDQNTQVLETMRLYSAAKQDIEKMFSGAALYLALSRCEYLMGLSFRVEGRKDEAAAFFEQGIAWAEESLAIQPASEAYRLLGTNISFLCEIRRSYGIANFGKIEENARKALVLNPDNLVAQYLIATSYVAAPWPFGNLRRGAALLEEILRQDVTGMEKEDLFNLYLMLEAACIKQKKPREARLWHERAAVLYPTNNFISLLVKPT
jgi:tetratricopeptide (TPR) repeat protein